MWLDIQPAGYPAKPKADIGYSVRPDIRPDIQLKI
jgi:hypothetical protein